MVASLAVAPADASASGSTPQAAESSAQFSTFTLHAGSPVLQTELQQANPLCRLAACTPLGRGACDRACGIADPAGTVSHTCPLGMEMRRIGAPAAGLTRWVGRRFTSVAALHRALDLLVAAGYDEDTILAHLPPNPIALPQELELAAQTLAPEGQLGHPRRACHHGRPARVPGANPHPVADRSHA
jgi:hypothetical protein